MIKNHPYTIGIILILLLSVCAFVLVYFSLGEQAWIVILIKWSIAPIFCAFIGAYYSKSELSFFWLLFLLIFPFIDAYFYYLLDQMNIIQDFRGVQGAMLMYQIFFVIYLLPVLIGGGAGLYAKKKKVVK